MPLPDPCRGRRIWRCRGWGRGFGRPDVDATALEGWGHAAGLTIVRKQPPPLFLSSIEQTTSEATKATFGVINSSLDLGGMFGPSTTAQFSVRAPAEEALQAIERAAVAIGAAVSGSTSGG